MEFAYIDKRGRRIHEGFAWASSFRAGLACVCKRGGEWAVINTAGMVVARLPSFQKEATCVREEMVLVTDGMKCGFINLRSELVIPPRFPFAGHFSEGLAVVQTGKWFNFVDPTGRLVIEDQIEELGDYNDGMAMCKRSGKWYFLNHDLKVSLGPYDHANDFSCGVAKVIIDGQYYHVDTEGRVLFRGSSDTSAFCFEGFISFFADTKQGFVDKKGAVVIKPSYDSVEMFSEGLAVVQSGDRISVLDACGAVVMTPNVDSMSHFSEGLAAINIGGKFGYMDRNGQVVVDAIYSVAGSFSEGFAAVGFPRGRN